MFPRSSLLRRTFLQASSRLTCARCVPAYRCLSTTRAEAPTQIYPAPEWQPGPNNTQWKDIYQGPLNKTFRRLKILSLSSLALTTTISPFFFVIESNLPTVARISLACIAVTTSAVSTAMVTYFTKTYVTNLRKIKHPGETYELEFTTQTLFLKPRITKVYDTAFLVDSQRPLAKWELPYSVLLPASRQSDVPRPGTEETVAETFSEKGDRLGSWVVKWGENGEGNCQPMGKVVRHFNAHLELLHRK